MTNQIIRFIFILLPVLSFGQGSIKPQIASDTIPAMQEHYKLKTAEFNRQPRTMGKIIFVGNSITEMGNWKELLNDSNVINRGIGGDISHGVLRRIDEIIEQKPSKVFIKIGINDLGKGIDVSFVANNIEKIIDKIHKASPVTKIYLQSLLPVNPTCKGFPANYNKQKEIIKLNKLLKKITHSNNAIFVNIFPLFTDSKGYLKSKYTMDGLHLTSNGYKVWVEYLRKENFL